jgi:HEPN domain-containing protein
MSPTIEPDIPDATAPADQGGMPSGAGRLTIDEKFGLWLDIAERDLRMARVSVSSGEWMYVSFFCEQAIEKLVKGLYVLYVSDDVPKIHKIMTIIGRFENRLTEKIPDDYSELFDDLSSQYLQDRYVDYDSPSGLQVAAQEANDMLTLTEEAFKWLLTMKP